MGIQVITTFDMSKYLQLKRSNPASPFIGGARQRLDLRNHEEFRNFQCIRYTYALNNPVPINLTTHSHSSAQHLRLAHDSLFGILKEALTISAMNGMSDECIIHVYLHCTGLDTDFIFNPIGEKAKRLHQFIWNDNSALDSMVDKFSEITQSGKPVILD